MKGLIVKYWLLSYDVKVFGVKYRSPRVVNTLTPLLVIGGLYNLFTLGFDIWQFLALVPFFAVGIYTAIRKIDESDLPFLDWEQELQLMQKPDWVKTKWNFNFPENYRKRLQDRHDIKYKGHEKFVHPWRFFLPFMWIAIACVLWGTWGFNEAGFP